MVKRNTTKFNKTRKSTSRGYDSDVDDLDTPVSVLDSDIDRDVAPIDHDVNYKIQSMQSNSLMSLMQFFDDGKMINPSGDPTTNIIDRMKGRCYNVPDRRIPKMFKYLDKCRKDKVRVMITERQRGVSGIMLDFDILQDGEDDQLTDKMFNMLTSKVIKLLISILDFKENNFVVHVGITRRPKIMYREDVECYKDGFHMLIPGIQIDRSVKLLIIQKLIENELVDQVLAGVEPANIITKGKKYVRSDFLDTMSATVPVFFIGSATKKGHSPYHLSHVYSVDVDIEQETTYIDTDDRFRRGHGVNICHEFSLNFEAPGGVIKKCVYEPQEKYASVIASMSDKNSSKDDAIRNNFGELSMNSVHDSVRNEIKDLLDILNVKRADDYGDWRSVLCALASVSTSYVDLAEYFSRKSKKFNMADFETAWLGVTTGRATGSKSVTMGTIHYWAKLDNPERYLKFRETTVYEILYQMVYEGYREGMLSHADVGKLCYKLLKNKFVTDIPEGEKKRVWYEFVLEDDDHVDGELYKWHKWYGMPTTLSLYISETLPKLFGQVFTRVKQNYTKSTGDISKYYYKVLTNFKASMRKLGDRGYKSNVVKEAEDKFARRGFADKLDTDPLIRGVANGVLKLSLAPNEGPVLIQGYHQHLVSQFTPVPYIAFDPHDPITKKILIALRNLFPDNEPDSFHFTMMYLASTIDSLPVESMFMITTGGGANGKSFLTELHKGAIGPMYGVKLPLSYLVCKSSHADNATPAVMMLQHASLATYSESNKHEVLNAARIKELTGLETIAGRKLHQDMINFKPRAHHWVCSNFDLDLGGSVDYGLKRRIEYNPLKIKFVNPLIDAYDKNDPYQRIADDTVTSSWTEDPEVLGRYLGIMTWYHWHLHRKYQGKVKLVPHPHINTETAKYIVRQDVVAAFIEQRFISVPDIENDDGTTTPQEFPMVQEIQKYIKWHALNHGSIPAKGLIETFQNDRIGKHINMTKRGVFMRGHKFLDTDEKPDKEAGEAFAHQVVNSITVPDDNFGIADETADQYYEKICAEYKSIKHIFTNVVKYDVAVDTIVDYNAIGNNDFLPDYSIPIGERKQRDDNVEINGHILQCGIVLTPLDSPKRNNLTSATPVGNMAGFLPDSGDIDIDININIDIDIDNYIIVNSGLGADEDLTDMLRNTLGDDISD